MNAPSVQNISLFIAATAVVASPLTTWLVSSRQQKQALQLQTGELAHRMALKKMELDDARRRAWGEELRTQVSNLLAYSVPIASKESDREIGIKFTEAQAQVILLLGKQRAEEAKLDTLTRKLLHVSWSASTSTSDDLLSEYKRVKNDIVDLTINILEE